MSLPVKVFCWRRGESSRAAQLADRAPRRRARTAASGAAPPARAPRSAAQRPVPRDSDPSATITRARSQQLQLARQVRKAVVALLGVGLFAGRRAAVDRGDPGVAESQPVVARDRRRLVREPGAVERRVEPVAGAIAGEHAAGAVRAVRRRRQADDHDPRRRVAEPGHAAAPSSRSPRWRFGGSAATSSRQSTSRGQRRQRVDLASSAPVPPAVVTRAYDRAMDAKPASASASALVRWMGIVDANSAGFVHGGIGDEAVRRGRRASPRSATAARRVVTAGMDRMTFLEPGRRSASC